jgi:hypothetical protein
MLACSPPRDATRSFRWAARDQENWAWMPDNARLFASATPHEVKQRLHGGIMFAHQGRGSLAGFDNHGRNIHSELRLPFKKCLLPDRATGSTNNAFKAIALPDRATRTTKMLACPVHNHMQHLREKRWFDRYSVADICSTAKPHEVIVPVVEVWRPVC